jgi:hypothetical protein
MIGMLGRECRLVWVLRPCISRDRYDRYGRLGLLITVGFKPM